MTRRKKDGRRRFSNPIIATSKNAAANEAHQTTNTNTASLCDRRLSRAARHVVKESLVKMLALLDPDHRSTERHKKLQAQETLQAQSVWTLIDRAVELSSSSHRRRKDKEEDSTCPLLHDMYQRQEEHAQVISASSKKLYSVSTPFALGLTLLNPPAERRRYTYPTDWYQCGLCSKQFTTRYYLDQHLERMHTNDLLILPPPTEDNNNETSAVVVDDYCPAVAWCKFLSLPVCHDIALELEPYYDRGTGGYGPDRVAVGRKLAQQSEAALGKCQPLEMKESYQQCNQVMETCFGGGPADDSSSSPIANFLQHNLCHNMETCQDRLHHLLLRNNNDEKNVMLLRRHVREWQHVWHDYYEAHHHEIGTLGMIVLMGVFVWYGLYAWKLIIKQQRQRHREQTTPRLLLLGKKTTNGSSSLSSSGSSSSSSCSPSSSSAAAVARNQSLRRRRRRVVKQEK